MPLRRSRSFKVIEFGTNRKPIYDFLLPLIELLSLGVTAEALRAIIGWKSAISFQWGSVDPKFQVEGVAPHQPFFISEN